MRAAEMRWNKACLLVRGPAGEKESILRFNSIPGRKRAQARELFAAKMRELNVLSKTENPEAEPPATRLFPLRRSPRRSRPQRGGFSRAPGKEDLRPPAARSTPAATLAAARKIADKDPTGLCRLRARIWENIFLSLRAVFSSARLRLRRHLRAVQTSRLSRGAQPGAGRACCQSPVVTPFLRHVRQGAPRALPRLPKRGLDRGGQVCHYAATVITKGKTMEVCIACMHGKPIMLELREGVVFLDNEPQPIKNLSEEELTAFSEAVRRCPPARTPAMQLCSTPSAPPLSPICWVRPLATSAFQR